MKTSMMRALVITVAVLTLGLLSMTKASGQGVRSDPAPVPVTPSEDPKKAYDDAYSKAFYKAKSDEMRKLETPPPEGGSSGGSCG